MVMPGVALHSLCLGLRRHPPEEQGQGGDNGSDRGREDRARDDRDWTVGETGAGVHEATAARYGAATEPNAIPAGHGAN